MTYELRQWNHPDLKAFCEPMTASDDRGFIADMRRIMLAHKGVGLAAPQIGVLKRVILVENKVMLNPVITHRSARTCVAVEGCLSYPLVFAKIERNSDIRLRFFRPGDNLDGEPLELGFDGMKARIIQHEVDHLDGICVIRAAWLQTQAEYAAAEGAK